LFDDTKEAEKVLHILETVTVGRVFQLTIAALFHTAILKIQVLFSFISSRFTFFDFLILII